MMKVLLVLGLVAVVLAQSCPNGCSNHGTCQSTGECLCAADYAGADCSIPDKELKNSKVEHGSVPIRQWKYYHITASNKPELVIEVNQTDVTGDCDTYVREGDYPTKQEFDVRDITTKRHTHLVIPNPNGKYYIGVYGFLTTQFDIAAFMESDCASECSGHGTCDILDDGGFTCNCDQGFFGDECDIHPTVMVNDTDYSDAVGVKNWTYYTILNEKNAVEVFMEQDPIIGSDCDLYLKFNELPSLSNFDARDTSVAFSHDLKIAEAEVGAYQLGIYGYKGCSFSVKSITYNECPNQCSGATHGICYDDACSCLDRFGGEGCESMLNPLAIEHTEFGFVAQKQWNYYFFQVRSEADAYVNVQYAESSMDCDLYIKQGSQPSLTNFDYREFSFRTNKTISIADPVQGDQYNIGVYGYRTCTYNITYGLTYSCPNDCSGNGNCEEGNCLCDEGFGGDDCSEATNVLHNGVPIDSTLNARYDQWNYYTFEVQAEYDVTLLMKEMNSTGYVWLYQSRDDFPDSVHYDNADTETNSNIHDVTYAPVNAETCYVGVSTSPLAPGGLIYEFKLEAYQAGFNGVKRRLPMTEVKR